MTLAKIKEILKGQFEEISKALFRGSLNIGYVESTDRVYADASSMFNLVRYSDSNFEYFYIYHQHLLENLDIINLTELKQPISRLKVTGDVLLLDFIRQSDSSESQIIKPEIFLELNFVANLFVFIHEAGHTNQLVTSGDGAKDANHFSEYNADYYSFSKILNYYHTLRKSDYDEYVRRVSPFGSEQHFIRCIIITSLTVIYFSCLGEGKEKESETHPSIKKRFCNLLYQMQIQLEDNFQYLFATDTLADFLVDIFTTLTFIEAKLFEKEEPIFNGLLNYCVVCFDAVKQAMEHHTKFIQFNK